MEPHEVLGVPADADPAQVRAAYRRLAREHHPDRHANGTPAQRDAAAARMAEITEAYQLLSDPDAMSRRRLRTHRATGPGQPPPGQPFDYRQAAPSEFTAEPSGRWAQTPPPPPPSSASNRPHPNRSRPDLARRYTWLLVAVVAVLVLAVLL